jgi:hypothetical protein
MKQVHFADNNFNVMQLKKTPFQEKLLNRWNEKRRFKDGAKFKDIEKQFTKRSSQALLYGSYIIKNKFFYIQEMFEDNFDTYKKNIAELRQIEQVFTTDLTNVIIHARENKISTKSLFVSENSIPQIFKMQLSFNSIVILNDVFNILELNKNIQINSLEEVRYKELKLNIKKYKMLIQNYLDKSNWKEITKDILTK